MPAVALVLASWIPDPSPEFGSSPTPFVLLMVAGFVIAVLGHLVRSRPMVAIGVAVVFFGTFVFPLAVYLSKSG